MSNIDEGASAKRPVLLQPDNHNKKYEALFDQSITSSF